jgi:hypothetical protein
VFRRRGRDLNPRPSFHRVRDFQCLGRVSGCFGKAGFSLLMSCFRACAFRVVSACLCRKRVAKVSHRCRKRRRKRGRLGQVLGRPSSERSVRTPWLTSGGFGFGFGFCSSSTSDAGCCTRARARRDRRARRYASVLIELDLGGYDEQRARQAQRRDQARARQTEARVVVAQRPTCSDARAREATQRHASLSAAPRARAARHEQADASRSSRARAQPRAQAQAAGAPRRAQQAARGDARRDPRRATSAACASTPRRSARRLRPTHRLRAHARSAREPQTSEATDAPQAPV